MWSGYRVSSLELMLVLVGYVSLVSGGIHLYHLKIRFGVGAAGVEALDLLIGFDMDWERKIFFESPKQYHVQE